MRRRCPKTERAGRRQAGVGKRARERVTADLVEHGAVAGLVQVEPSAIPRVDRMLQREQLPNIVEAQRAAQPSDEEYVCRLFCHVCNFKFNFL